MSLGSDVAGLGPAEDHCPHIFAAAAMLSDTMLCSDACDYLQV